MTGPAVAVALHLVAVQQVEQQVHAHERATVTREGEPQTAAERVHFARNRAILAFERLRWAEVLKRLPAANDEATAPAPEPADCA